jgi:hypothetical protein
MRVIICYSLTERTNWMLFCEESCAKSQQLFGQHSPFSRLPYEDRQGLIGSVRDITEIPSSFPINLSQSWRETGAINRYKICMRLFRSLSLFLELDLRGQWRGPYAYNYAESRHSKLLLNSSTASKNRTIACCDCATRRCLNTDILQRESESESDQQIKLLGIHGFSHTKYQLSSFTKKRLIPKARPQE